LQGIILGLRTWTSKPRAITDLPREFTELTVLSLSDGKLGRYNVPSDIFAEHFAKTVAEAGSTSLTTKEGASVVEFTTIDDFGRTKLTHATPTKKHAFIELE